MFLLIAIVCSKMAWNAKYLLFSLFTFQKMGFFYKVDNIWYVLKNCYLIQFKH